jgi:hypothetical protein
MRSDNAHFIRILPGFSIAKFARVQLRDCVASLQTDLFWEFCLLDNSWIHGC